MDCECKIVSKTRLEFSNDIPEHIIFCSLHNSLATERLKTARQCDQLRSDHIWGSVNPSQSHNGRNRTHRNGGFKMRPINLDTFVDEDTFKKMAQAVIEKAGTEKGNVLEDMMDWGVLTEALVSDFHMALLFAVSRKAAR